MNQTSFYVRTKDVISVKILQLLIVYHVNQIDKDPPVPAALVFMKTGLPVKTVNLIVVVVILEIRV